MWSERAMKSLDQGNHWNRRRGQPATPRGAVLSALRVALILLGVTGVVAAIVLTPTFVERHLAYNALTPVELWGLQEARLFAAVAGIAAIVLAIYIEPVLNSRLLLWAMYSERRIHAAIFALPLIAMGAIAIYKAVFGIETALYHILTIEDSFVEWLTAIIYFAGFVIALGMVSTAYRYEPVLGFGYTALSLFCLFVALEEISYGQRIFGFATPESLSEMNAQGETNLHNIESIQFITLTLAPLTIGLFGALGWTLLPLLARASRRLASIGSFIAPPWFTATYFAPIALYDAYPFIFGETDVIIRRDGEVIELVLSIGFLLFILHNLLRLKRLLRLQQGQVRRPAAAAA